MHVKNSREYVTFWHVWHICTTNFEIFIRTNSSQMSNFRRVEKSNVFVTPMNEEFVRILHTCDRFARIWKSNESVTRVKIRTYLLHLCKFFTCVNNSHEFFTRATNTYARCVTNSSQTSVCHAFIFVRSAPIPLKFRMQIPYPSPRIASANLYFRQDIAPLGACTTRQWGEYNCRGSFESAQ